MSDQAAAPTCTQAETKPKSEPTKIEANDDLRSIHMLLENEGKKSTQCHLCKLSSKDGMERTSIYSCTACEKGFHVNCFTFFHARDTLKQVRPDLLKAIQDAEKRGGRPRRNRKNKCTSTLKTARVPFKM